MFSAFFFAKLSHFRPTYYLRNHSLRFLSVILFHNESDGFFIFFLWNSWRDYWNLSVSPLVAHFVFNAVFDKFFISVLHVNELPQTQDFLVPQNLFVTYIWPL